MSKIVGIEGLSGDQLRFEIQNGGRFVFFQYCISILVMSLKRSSDIRFLRTNESHISSALPYCALSHLLGWWGIPWGPIWAVSTTYRNLSGGVDVTQEVLASLSAPSAPGASPFSPAALSAQQLERDRQGAHPRDPADRVVRVVVP